MAEKIIRAIGQPINLDFGTIHQSLSIGIPLPSDKSQTGDKLMQQSDLALYESKASGRDKVRVFREDMQQRIDRLTQLEMGIREGLLQGEFSLAYPLQVDDQWRAVGLEALIGWIRANGSSIAPAEFIPLAQDTGMINKLGSLMMTQELSNIQAWERICLPDDFRILINFSSPEFLHQDFPNQVVSLLQATGVSGRRLRFDITEDAVLSDLASAAERMQLLMEYQIEFSLDDFGIGYSSFAYLRYLPVGEVRIDQGFVRRFLQHPQDAAIVRAIIDLGRSLGLWVVVEGLESQEGAVAGTPGGVLPAVPGLSVDRPQPEGEAGLLGRLHRLQPSAD